MFPIGNAIPFDHNYRAIEFFAGLGGFAAAWPEVSIAAAFDIHQVAASIYSANFKHPYRVREIESIACSEIQALRANLWWLSPPCQPYTTRGNRADIEDPRARSFLHLLAMIPECLPEFIVLENVFGFAQSIAHSRLLDQLRQTNYRWQSLELCPTQMGWPNKRPRFYLIASRTQSLAAWREPPRYSYRVADFLEPGAALQGTAPELQVDAELVARIEPAMDRCDPASDRPSACFASSYGRAAINSGSYLRLTDGTLPAGAYRRFAPREVANLLGFPSRFSWASDIPARTLWKLLGNSLSLPAVRYLLSHLPGGPSARLPWR